MRNTIKISIQQYNLINTVLSFIVPIGISYQFDRNTHEVIHSSISDCSLEYNDLRDNLILKQDYAELTCDANGRDFMVSFLYEYETHFDLTYEMTDKPHYETIPSPNKRAKMKEIANLIDYLDDFVFEEEMSEELVC